MSDWRERARQAAQVPEDDGIPVMWEGQIMALPLPEWLIDELLQEEGVVIAYGASQSFKSFLVMDAMLRITHGLSSYGGLDVEKHGGCAYVCAEGGGAVNLRLQAWNLYHGTQPGMPNAPHSPFFVVNQPINLADREEVDGLIRKLQGLEQQYGFKFVMIGFDTMAKCSTGTEENSAKEVGLIINNLDYIRAEMHLCVIGIDHTGKDVAKGVRGSSSKKGGVDTLLEISRPQGETSPLTRLYVEKQKDAENGREYFFEAHTVPLGTNKKGKPVSSLVLEPRSQPEELLKPKPYKPTSPGKPVNPLDDLRYRMAQHVPATGISASGLCKLLGMSKGHLDTNVRKALPDGTSVEVPIGGGVKRIFTYRTADHAPLKYYSEWVRTPPFDPSGEVEIGH